MTVYIFKMFADINECISDPCLESGTCVDDVNGYTCICAAGFTGSHCETSKSNDVQFQ